MVCVKIDRKSYEVLVTDIVESFDILYSQNTGRTMAAGARMTLDPLGTFIGHKITFRRKEGWEQEYDDLFEYLSRPRYDGMYVEVIHNQTTLSYSAYVSKGERKLKRVDPKTGKVYWGEFTVNVIPMEATVIP